MKQNFIIIPLLLAMASFAAKAPDPVALLKAKDKELQTLLRLDEKKVKDRRQDISKLINSIFDFQELGKKALGSSLYDSLPPEKQKEFVEAFQGMLEASSMKKLESYKTDSTVYGKPKYKNDGRKAEITVHSFSGGTESILEYKMLLENGTWRAWDLVIDDLSTYRNYKEQFKRILKKKSLDDLIQILKNKAKKEGGGEADDKKSSEKPSEKKAGQASDKKTDPAKE